MKQELKPGDEVRAVSTGRRMVVRSLESGRLVCAWFDGRYYREVSLLPEAVRASCATQDDRVVQL